MTNCPYLDCKRDIEQGLKFCLSCYEKISWCPSCKESNRVMALFCCKCGERLSEKPEWKMYKGNPQLTGHSQENFFFPRQGERLEEKWRKELEEDVFSSLIVAYGYIFISLKNGTIYILKQFNGEEKAMLSPKKTQEMILFTPAIDNKVLFVFSLDTLYAYNLTPLANKDLLNSLWECKLADNKVIATNLLIDKDKIFVNVFDNGTTKVCAVNSKTGKLIWKSLFTLNGQFPFMALKDNNLITASKDWIYGINIADGSKSWEMSLSVNVNIPPVIMGNQTYLFDGEGFLISLDLNTGKSLVKSNIHVPDVTSFGLSESNIFVGDGMGRFYKFTLSGEEEWCWENKAIGMPDTIRSSPTLSQQTAMVGSINGYLHLFNLSTSLKVISIRPFTQAINSSPVISNGWIYVCSIKGGLAGYSLESEKI